VSALCCKKLREQQYHIIEKIEIRSIERNGKGEF
jgi:hypothetical protein